MKDMSRDGLTLSPKKGFMKVVKKDLFKSVLSMWGTYRESSTTTKIKTWYSGPSRTNIILVKVNRYRKYITQATGRASDDQKLSIFSICSCYFY